MDDWPVYCRFTARTLQSSIIHTVVMRPQFAVLLLLAIGGIGEDRQGAWARLPGDVRNEVQRLGCQIPEDQNIIRGQFERARATNWAVLCSQGRTRMLVVFWSTKTGEANLYRTFDGDGQRLSVRRIATVNRRFILKYCSLAHGTLSRIEHDGILDQFNGSVVHYYNQGAWIDLPVTYE